MRVHTATGTSLSSIMLITNRLESSPSGGREMLCKLNHDVLKEIYGDRLTVLELSKNPIRGFKSVINAFRGYIDGINAEAIDFALREIGAKNIEKIFVDGSNFGGIVKVIKMRFPKVQLYTFFHNVEARFFWGSFRQNKRVHALAVAVANYLAEKKSVKYSDKLICLSNRDSRLLTKLYGRGATHISPMALEDKCPASYFNAQPQRPEQFVLFVGGTFYANRAGIAWFVREVVPRISVPICIVGRGFEALRSELEIPGKVTVVGSVDSLADWYHRAQFIIAPIFDGSGMKTKVAEALMYGKKVVGTPEAFSGYEDIADRVGWVCSTASGFVTAIELAKDAALVSFDHDLRALYEAHHSFTAARLRLVTILES